MHTATFFNTEMFSVTIDEAALLRRLFSIGGRRIAWG